MQASEIEVIVIPNGPDESWKKALKPFQSNSSVRVIPIKEENGNIARNRGLEEARGQYIRFLDDDDYLLQEGAIKQYELIQSSNADVVSGSGNLIDAKGRCFDTWYQPDLNDFCEAVLGPWRVCLSMAHVYKHSIIKNARWNQKTSGRQDVEWLVNLCAEKELNWKKIDYSVGAWQHHWGLRISSSEHFKKIRNKICVPMLMRAFEKLKEENRLSEMRRRAVSLGLWDFVHGSFFLEPSYWSQIAATANKIDPSARPIQPIYNFSILRHLNPITIQWMMLPKRWLFHKKKYLFRILHIHN